MYSTHRSSSGQGGVLKKGSRSLSGVSTWSLMTSGAQRRRILVTRFARECVGFDSLIYTASESKQETAFLFDEDFSRSDLHLPLNFLSFLPFSCASFLFPTGSPSRMMTLMHKKKTVLLLLVNLLSYDTTCHYFPSCFQMKYLPVYMLKLCIICNYNCSTQMQYTTFYLQTSSFFEAWKEILFL